MKIEFQLTKDDIVEFNEYHSKHSDLHKKTKRRNRIIFPIVYLVIAGFGVASGDYAFATAFAAISALWFFFYPIYEKKRYRNYFIKHVEENFSNVSDEPTTIELKEDGIYSRSHIGESTYKYSIIEKIVENPDVTYIYIGKGMALVLPHDRISNENREFLVTEVRKRIHQPSANQAR